MVGRQGKGKEQEALDKKKVAHPTQAYFLTQRPHTPVVPAEAKRSPSAKVKKASSTSGSEPVRSEQTVPNGISCHHFRRLARQSCPTSRGLYAFLTSAA